MSQEGEVKALKRHYRNAYSSLYVVGETQESLENHSKRRAIKAQLSERQQRSWALKYPLEDNYRTNP